MQSRLQRIVLQEVMTKAEAGADVRPKLRALAPAQDRLSSATTAQAGFYLTATFLTVSPILTTYIPRSRVNDWPEPLPWATNTPEAV